VTKYSKLITEIIVDIKQGVSMITNSNQVRLHQRVIALVLVAGITVMSSSSLNADNGNGNGHVNHHFTNEQASQDLMAQQIATDAQPHGATAAPENFQEYAADLAQVLAQFTPAQQQEIFYGN
jgi:hypothetical protein